MKEVFIRIMGGLGNRLFICAFAIYLKKKRYNVFYYYDKKNDHNVENNIIDNILSKYYIIKKNVPKDHIKLKDNSPFIFNEILLNEIKENLNNNKKINIDINGYFQTYLYFNDFKNDLINDYKNILFNNKLKNNINKKYKELDFNNQIFIHIRGGDYFKHTNHLYDLNNYYIKSIKYFLKKYENINFIIFTNDIDYSNKIIKNIKENNIKFNYNILDEDVLESLYLMTLCKKGGIGTNSSYSWWGSYLNIYDNEIILPNVWYKNNNFYKDIYFEKIKIIDI